MHQGTVVRLLTHVDMRVEGEVEGGYGSVRWGGLFK